MDVLIKEFTRDISMTSGVTITNVIVSLLLSFLLCLLMSKVYSITHRGVSYSQSFVQTVVIMGVTVSLIMIIIGSNIARAFSLVGALSIIRFRNPVKESRDVGYIFMAMAVGMACGTHFFLVAAVATVLLSGIVLAMHHMDFGAREAKEIMLRIQIPSSIDHETTIHKVLKKTVNSFAIVSIDALGKDQMKELLYVIEPKRKLEPEYIISEISKIDKETKVSVILGQDSVDL